MDVIGENALLKDSFIVDQPIFVLILKLLYQQHLSTRAHASGSQSLWRCVFRLPNDAFLLSRHFGERELFRSGRECPILHWVRQNP